MPDFSKMTIVELGNYLSELLNSLPQRPSQVFADRLSVLLSEYSNKM